MEKPSIPGYEVHRKIGSGGYGDVWLAQKDLTNEWRAIKIVRKSKKETAERFTTELDAVKNYAEHSGKRKNLVHIIDANISGDGSYLYYVMDLADDYATGRNINQDTYRAKTLKEELKVESVLSVKRCIRMGIELTTALAYLHSKGLIHRDIKPANILFINNVPRLADMGILTPVQDVRSHIGTKGYVPPEGHGKTQGDVYSLGVVLYEALCGPSSEPCPWPAIKEADKGDPRWQELHDILLTACSYDPKDRYKDAGAFRDALKQLIPSRKSNSNKAFFRTAGITTMIIGGLGLLKGVAAALGYGRSVVNTLIAYLEGRFWVLPVVWMLVGLFFLLVGFALYFGYNIQPVIVNIMKED